MVTITKYNPQYRDDVINICWRTGYMGEDAEGYFDDPYLFALLFCLYYIDYEPQNCFIAIDNKNDRAIGYILSSFNSIKQEKEFRKKMTRKILRRAFLYTIWRYPRTFRTLLYFRSVERNFQAKSDEINLLSPYPAHLHIDILPEFQRRGIGSQLIKSLEVYLRSNQVTGVHLGTSNLNYKAIPFYKKHGYKILFESPPGYGMWPTAREAKSLIFAKKLTK